MARPLRIEFPDAIYHVMARGNGRQALFHGDDDYQRMGRLRQWQASPGVSWSSDFCASPLPRFCRKKRRGFGLNRERHRPFSSDMLRCLHRSHLADMTRRSPDRLRDANYGRSGSVISAHRSHASQRTASFFIPTFPGQLKCSTRP